MKLHLEAGKQQGHKYDEGHRDPDDEDALVEHVVEGEPHVGRQLLHRLDVLLHGQLSRSNNIA